MSATGVNEPLAAREAPASYVLNVQRIRPGYKQTEVGVIPEDWEVRKLGEGIKLTSGHHVLAQHCNTDGDGVAYITGPADFSNGVIQHTKYTTRPGTICGTNDILVTVKGSGAGTLVLSDAAYCISRQLMAMRVNSWSTPFIYFSLLQDSALFGAAATGLIPGLSRSDILNKSILVPPTKAEQEAIAEALSDADALIEALEQLIAKKRHLKQGAMQELLTGKKRLPGFSGEWEVKRLGEICYMKSGEGITSAQIDEHSPFPCYGGNGLRGFTNRYTHDGNYALIGRQGALCGNVVAVTGKFFASEHAIVVTPLNEIDIHWLACVLIRMNLNQYSESSAQPGLSVSKLLALDGIVPPTKEEQTAIATLLSDMDTEIAALETRLAKTRELKQGMMQELLTGKIRLGTRASSPHAGETPALPWTPRSPRSKPGSPRPANSSKA